jgi:hypothetical protein
MSNYNGTLLTYIKSKVSNATYVSMSSSLNSIVGSLEIRINPKKIGKQYYNATLGPYIIPTSSNGYSIDQPNMVINGNTSPSTAPPPKRYSVRLNYGTEYFIADFINKGHVADYMSLGGTYLKDNNLTLYQQLAGYINQPVSGTIESCKNTKFGVIYKFPWRGQREIGTKWQKDYVTPGQCINDID